MTLPAVVYFAQPDALKGSLGQTLKEVHPVGFFGVPRVWEKIEEKMKEVGAQGSWLRKTIVGWAKSVCLAGNYAGEKHKFVTKILQ